MKTRRLLAATALLVLLGTGFTLYGWPAGGNVDFPVEGLGPGAAERAETSLFSDIVTRGDEVLLAKDVNESGFSGHRLLYSPDAGRNWEEVLFDGVADPGMSIHYLTAREGQWIALGWQNQQAIPFTSADGRRFTRHGAAFDWPTGLQGELLGTAEGWAFVGVETPNGNPLLARLYTSRDGSAWAKEEPLLAGLPAITSGFRITGAAAGGGTMVIAGQTQGNRIGALAYASSDAGKTWKNLSADASAVGFFNNGFRTVEWSGADFRFTGFAWPDQTLANPVGMAANWSLTGTWNIRLDDSWADPHRNFPWTPSIANRPSAALAIQEFNDDSSGTVRLLHQAPGKSWSPLPGLSQPDQGEVRINDEAAPVDDGFLLTTAVTKGGNYRPSVLHVSDDGIVTDRTPSMPRGGSAQGATISSFATRNGVTSAFGSVGSKPVLWRLGGQQQISDYAPLDPALRERFFSLKGGPKGLMLLGSTTNERGSSPLVWSKVDGTEWAASKGPIFGGSLAGKSSTVTAVLPSSHGFLAAGRYEADDIINAGMSRSEDGEAWNRVWTHEFTGTATQDRGITSLAETPTTAVLAGGYIDAGGVQQAVVWASSDTRDWKTGRLPTPEGFRSASVVSVTAGAKAAVALVEARSPGQPPRYVMYSSEDDGASWRQGSIIQETSRNHTTSQPHLLAIQDGFVLIATQGEQRRQKPILLTSKDGRDFSQRQFSHPAPDGEDLNVSAVGLSDGKLLIAGHTGPSDARNPFCIQAEAPRL